MGKRELLIALAFVVAGTVAFQLSAPPAPSSGTGFSFSRLIDTAKRGMRGNQNYAAPERALTFAAGAEITELRLTGSSGPVKIVGEARTDVAMALTVFSTGETEGAAIAIANKTEVRQDRVGGVLTLTVKFPEEETQTSAIVLTVPQRLAVRLDGTRETTISGVRAVDFTSPARGTTKIERIAERVTGTQNGGTITLAAIGALKMTLSRTRARVSEISGESTLDVQDGDTEITTSRGALTIDERRGDITIRGHKGPVKVSGTDGRVRVVDATAELRMDMRRAEIDAELASGAAGSLVTTDEELRVTWKDMPGVQIDAVANNGSIDAADWSLTPVKSATDTRLDATLGRANGSAPLVALRNQGANIVLKKSSKK